MSNKQQKTLSVAIIGAGMAGLSCAVQLQQAGIQVTVFEKSRGLGGRMATRRGEHWQCDHGAQYFTARSHEFRQVVEDWLRAGVVEQWLGRITHFGDRPARLPAAAGDKQHRYVGVPGMSAPARLMSQQLDIQNNHRVTGLIRAAGGWQLRFEGTFAARSDDTTEPAAAVYDHVVLAIPSPQAAELLATLAPDLASRAQQHPMAPCWSVMITIPDSANAGFDAAFVNGEDTAESALSWIARNNSKPGRSGRETWLLHASASWSETHLESPPDQVISALRDEFLRYVPGASNLIRQAEVHAHRWRYAIPQTMTDHNSKPASTAHPTGFHHSRDLGLSLCGDWLMGGRVEGAWLSGYQLAHNLLAGFDAQHGV